MTLTPTKFDTLLVANRGEIACRVMRTARRMGLKTVAVYSDADATARHVREADEAVRLGPAAARESYLNVDAVIEAAQRTGTGAIHPGYGFLSENGTFVKALEQAGITFVGPPASAIAAMGDKSAAKARMANAGVPLVPGYHGDDQGDALLRSEADKIGYPVMLKASAGGGGKGMRVVESGEGFQAALDGCRRESKAAFGDDRMLIEKYLVQPRHVEVQVFCDRYGNGVYLFERDCSVQRRHQKVIEEAPAPGMTTELRAAMGDAAVRAAQEIGYVGAGTVEFLLDSSPGQDGAFYFMEMNPRLQVEHPVTEMVYDIDLVEWQLRVAQGEAIPLSQDDINARRHGHAIEVRLCAEDPAQNYLPQTGTLLEWTAPEGIGVRTDHGLRSGHEISPYYDSMQAKVIAWGEDRETARVRLLKALEDCTFLGVVSNKDYLTEVLAEDAFVSGDFSTSFVERYFPQKVISKITPSSRHVALAAVALYVLDAEKLAAESDLSEELLGWHSAHEFPTDFKLRWRDTDYELELLVHDGRLFKVDVGDAHVEIELGQMRDGAFDYICEGVKARGRMARNGDVLWLTADGVTHPYTDLTFAPAEGAAPGSDGRILAHSDGKIVAVNVTEGDRVEKGKTLVVLEAMKMEFQLATPVPGVVKSVSVQAGDQVKGRQLLVELEPDAEG